MLKKVLLAVTGTIIGIILLLLIAVGCVFYVSPVRQAVLRKALPIVEEQAGYDIDLGDLSLVMRDSLPSDHSPFTFHLSPFKLYRAYKGKADLPIEIAIDSLFVGHRGIDTLIYTHSLRLDAKLMTANREAAFNDFLSIPIIVERLHLEETMFHSNSLIETVGVDAIVGLLDVCSPELIITKGQYPLHGLRLNDVYVGIDLRDTPPDTTTQDTTPLLLAFDAPTPRCTIYILPLHP